MELEPARTDCAGERIGCGAAISSLSAENGDAGAACGGRPTCVLLYTPAPCKKSDERGAHTAIVVQLGRSRLDAARPRSARLRCHWGWRAGLQLGLGAGYFGVDRSGGYHVKHGAAGGRLWRALEIHERGQSEFQPRFGDMAAVDGRSAYAGGGRDRIAAGK